MANACRIMSAAECRSAAISAHRKHDNVPSRRTSARRVAWTELFVASRAAAAVWRPKSAAPAVCTVENY